MIIWVCLMLFAIFVEIIRCHTICEWLSMCMTFFWGDLCYQKSWNVLINANIFVGVQHFSDDIQTMLGFQPGIFWKICWAFICPICLIVSIVCVYFYLIFSHINSWTKHKSIWKWCKVDLFKGKKKNHK